MLLPKYFGWYFVQSGKVGVDARMARSAVKGRDGRIYTPVKNIKGETEYKSPQDLADATVAFPNELKRGDPYVAALTNGKVRMVPREKVDFEIPDMESTLSLIHISEPRDKRQSRMPSSA